MSAGHTPGPWPMAYTGDGKRIVIGEGLVEGPNGYEVAEVYSDDCPPEIAEANARLIAAAPEMLEALYQYVSDLRYPPTGDSIQRRIKRAEAVIAKATGGAA